MDSNHFQDLLDRDLAWRRQEISSLYTIAQQNESNVLIKSLLLIIYSHWEGFIKNSFKLYLDFVNKRDIKISDLTVNYKAIHLKSIANKCLSSASRNTLERELEFIQIHSESLDDIFSIEEAVTEEADSSIIDASGNLKPDVFFNLCNIVGLPDKRSIRIRKQWIDEKLVKNRHAIGHGNRVLRQDSTEFDLTLSDISEIKEIILAIMMNYKEDLIEYASSEYYLASNIEQKAAYDIASNDQLMQEIQFS